MQGIFQKENTDKVLKYGIYRHLPTYEKIIRNLVSFLEKKLPKIEEIVHNGRSFPAGMIAGVLTIAIKPVISLLGQNGGLSTATFNDFIAFFEYLIAVCLIVNMVDAFVKAYYAKIYNIN
uniref:hypothetical protein n=1 Tax=Ruminococcus bromii TaxID=40518 RepID=UPI003FD72703